jgi:hypothetical protein
MRRNGIFNLSISVLSLLVLSPSAARSTYLSEPIQLVAEGARFTWEDARSRSVKILVQYKDQDGNWNQSEMGSGFLISSDGLFVTAYHVMKYCLKNSQRQSGFAVSVDCSSAHPRLQYKAQNGGQDFEIELVSHLSREQSSKSDVQTPDETIKLRDFVIGRLKSVSSGAGFPHWELKDFQKGMIDLSRPAADFELKPLVPPKKVFVAGYPGRRDFAIARGFLNLTDERHRGYFAADIALYENRYLEAEGIPLDTQWGIGVENHMSGGAVVDGSGNVIGLIVNGNGRTAGVLSIENFLETFFSRSAEPGARPAVFLTPTNAPLYLKGPPAALLQ